MTTTPSAFPRTPADSAQHITQKAPSYINGDISNRATLPTPVHLDPPLAKRRTKADRRLLLELGRMRKPSRRRSSHKEMGKRMFFLLSGNHHMQKIMPPTYESPLEIDAMHEKGPLVSQYRLPSFEEGFSEWIQDTSHMKPIQSEVIVEGSSGELDGTVLRLPSIETLLGTAE